MGRARCFCGLLKQIDSALKSLNVEDAASLEKTLAELRELRRLIFAPVIGCFYPAFRYSEGVTMRVCFSCTRRRVNKSLSPATSKSAFARAAHSRNISSWGSRHSFTMPRIFTRMPRARIACSADVARCCSPGELLRRFARAQSLRQSHHAGGNPCLRSLLVRAPKSVCRDLSQIEARKSRRLCR